MFSGTKRFCKPTGQYEPPHRTSNKSGTLRISSGTNEIGKVCVSENIETWWTSELASARLNVEPVRPGSRPRTTSSRCPRKLMSRPELRSVAHRPSCNPRYDTRRSSTSYCKKVWGYLKQLEKNGTWDVARKGKHRKPGSASRDPDQGRTHQRKERTEAPRPRPRRQAPGQPNGTFHISPFGCRFLGRSPFFNARFWGRRPTRVNLQPVYNPGGTSNQCLPQTRGLAHRWLNVDHLKPDDFVLASNQRSCTSFAQPA